MLGDFFLYLYFRVRLHQTVNYFKQFTQSQEAELTEYSKEKTAYFYDLCFKDVESMAFENTVANEIKNPSDKETCLADRDWLTSPEAMSLGMAIGFNEQQWNIYQDNLKALYQKHQFQPS